MIQYENGNVHLLLDERNSGWREVLSPGGIQYNYQHIHSLSSEQNDLVIDVRSRYLSTLVPFENRDVSIK